MRIREIGLNFDDIFRQVVTANEFSTSNFIEFGSCDAQDADFESELEYSFFLGDQFPNKNTNSIQGAHQTINPALRLRLTPSDQPDYTGDLIPPKIGPSFSIFPDFVSAGNAFRFTDPVNVSGQYTWDGNLPTAGGGTISSENLFTMIAAEVRVTEYLHGPVCVRVAPGSNNANILKAYETTSTADPQDTVGIGSFNFTQAFDYIGMELPFSDGIYKAVAFRVTPGSLVSSIILRRLKEDTT